MNTRPRATKYRNLHRRDTGNGPVIWYDRVRDGRRIRRSTRCSTWSDAVVWRDLFEQRLEQEAHRLMRGEVPTFAEAAAEYLEGGMAGLAPSTQDDRRGMLKPDGSLLTFFGDRRVDEIRRGDIMRWWEQEVERNGISLKTGRNRLDALSGVLGRADDLYELGANPVDAARSVLRRRNRGKRARAASQCVADARQPIEEVSQVEAFVQASQAILEEAIRDQWQARLEKRRPRWQDSLDGHLIDMLLLDAGLRLGEACALWWGDFVRPEDPKDTSRLIHVRRALSRGKHLGPPKSGRAREVQMSRRLWAMLRRRYDRAGHPGANEWVFTSRSCRDLPGADPDNYRSRHFARVCQRAGLGKRRPKDLRDTYASQLITCGVQLAYISEQLGHANTDVTASRYARWCGQVGYRKPLEVRAGEVPADLLMRLGEGALQRSSG
jgi:integrase